MYLTYTFFIIVAWVIFILYWLVSSFSAKRNLKRDYRFIWLRFGLLALVLLFFRFAGPGGLNVLSAPLFPGTLFAACGVVLAYAGIGLAVWARVYLGRNWGMPMSVKENPELVTGGPYSYIRHPIYSGVFLAIFGSALASNAWWLIVFAPTLLYFVFSAKSEEKLMLQQFPDQYPEYMKRTKAFIPFVW